MVFTGPNAVEFFSDVNPNSLVLMSPLMASGNNATLVVAIIGVLVGLSALALNFYQNFIRKPKLHVRFYYNTQMSLNDPTRPMLFIFTHNTKTSFTKPVVG